jgi:hypothetical protein
MFSQSGAGAGVGVAPPGTGELAAFRAALAVPTAGISDAERIDRIRLLEELRGAVAAAQAAETAAFAASQRAGAVDERAERTAKSIAGQVGLARRVAPAQAARYVGWAVILTRELPATYAQLRAGRVSEWRAMLVARESAWLSRAHRAVVDAELAPQLEALGDRRVEAAAKALAYRLDPAGYVARLGKANAERRVGLRPAPDAMAWLCALLPVPQAVAAHTALGRHADTLIGAGDAAGRGRGQLMADTLVERLTGQASADAVPVEVHLLIPTDTLLHPDATEPGHLDGYGPLPAPTARALALATDHTGDNRAHGDGTGDGGQSGGGIDAGRGGERAGWSRTARRAGCGDCSPTPTPARSSRPSPAAATSAPGNAAGSSTATSTAAPATATPRSATSTTSTPPTPADRPASPTGKANAPPATTPNKPPAGPTPPSPTPTTPPPTKSKPPPPPDTTTAAPHPTHPTPGRRDAGRWLGEISR